MNKFISEEIQIDSLRGASGLRVLTAPIGTEDFVGLKARHYFSRALSESLDTEGRARFELVLSREDEDALLAELRACQFENWSIVGNDCGAGLRCLRFHVDFSIPVASRGVTFVIPVFGKTEGELRRAIGSILRSFRVAGVREESEIIVVDDGSSLAIDKILEDLREGAAPFSLKMVRNKLNRGVARSRNHGVKLAGNGIVMFLDADDEIHPNLVRTFLAQILAGANVVGSDMVIPSSGEIFVGRPQSASEIFVRNSFGSGIAIDLLSPSVKRLMRVQPLYNPIFSLCYEDWELNCVLRLIEARIAVVPVPLYLYHRKEGGRDAGGRRFHPYFKRLLPVSAKARAFVTRII